jgi:hypothetical protein
MKKKFKTNQILIDKIIKKKKHKKLKLTPPHI